MNRRKTTYLARPEHPRKNSGGTVSANLLHLNVAVAEVEEPSISLPSDPVMDDAAEIAKPKRGRPARKQDVEDNELSTEE